MSVFLDIRIGRKARTVSLGVRCRFLPSHISLSESVEL